MLVTLKGVRLLDVMKTSGPAATGLTFIWMPQLFAKMPAGNIFAILFFLGLSFAAFSSLISMIELTTRILVDFGVARRQAIVGVCTIGFTLECRALMGYRYSLRHPLACRGTPRLVALPGSVRLRAGSLVRSV